jgi:hypothetical protein
LITVAPVYVFTESASVNVPGPCLMIPPVPETLSLRNVNVPAAEVDCVRSTVTSRSSFNTTGANILFGVAFPVGLVPVTVKVAGPFPAASNVSVGGSPPKTPNVFVKAVELSMNNDPIVTSLPSVIVRVAVALLVNRAVAPTPLG